MHTHTGHENAPVLHTHAQQTSRTQHIHESVLITVVL